MCLVWWGEKEICWPNLWGSLVNASTVNLSLHNFYLPCKEKGKGKLTWLRKLSLDHFYFELTYQTVHSHISNIVQEKEFRVVFLHIYVCWDFYSLCTFSFSCIEAKHLDLLPITRSSYKWVWLKLNALGVL